MLPNINLLPKYEQQSVRSYRIFLIGLILFLLLTVLFVYFFINTRSSLVQAEQTLENLNQEKVLLEEQLATVSTDKQSETIEGVVSYVKNHIVPTSYFVDELIDLLPNHGYLNSFNYNYQSVSIETQFETMSDAATYIVDLNNSDYVRNVEVNQVNTFEQGTTDTEEENVNTYYKTIPRYSVSYSIDVHQANLKEAGGHNE